MKYRLAFPRTCLLLAEEDTGSVQKLKEWVGEADGKWKRYLLVPGEGSLNPISQEMLASNPDGTASSIAVSSVNYYCKIYREDKTPLAESKEKLVDSLKWASFAGVKRFLIAFPEGPVLSEHLVAICRMIKQVIVGELTGCDIKVMIECDFMHGWDLWLTAKAIAPEVGLCLSIASLYSVYTDEQCERMRKKWQGETCDMILCKSGSFKPNAGGHLALPLRSRMLVMDQCIQRQAHLAFEVTRLMETVGNDCQVDQNPDTHGWEYVQQVCKWLEYVYFKYSLISQGDALRLEYRDVLQEPLEPLANNLPMQIYAVFEEDVIKYNLYKQAIKEELKKMLAPSAPILNIQDTAEPASELVADECVSKDDPPVHIAYLGGGRGPLLTKCFEVLEEMGWKWTGEDKNFTNGSSTRTIIFTLVEKNPGVILLLQAKREMLPLAHWWKHVDIVQKDMREWEPYTPISLAFSELLGSIGDNELSPECLTLKCVNEQSVLIPRSSKSGFIPISADKLHSAAENHEKGYVCDMSTYAAVANEVKPAFEFLHSFETIRTALENKNAYDRFAKLEWTVTVDCSWMHGFAGYFEAQLSEKQYISTMPENKTDGMHSWFPLYLPIERPIWITKGDKVELHLWRQSSGNAVWYEWVVQVRQANKPAPLTTKVHNLNGSAWSIRKT